MEYKITDKNCPLNNMTKEQIPLVIAFIETISGEQGLTEEDMFDLLHTFFHRIQESVGDGKLVTVINTFNKAMDDGYDLMHVLNDYIHASKHASAVRHALR